ncbi:Retinoic acid induced 16-like protein-domain-containing protein [Phlebopus sp. FC_14]|nr:Retinoic acid induced 16-like protein-domain-containing protein [Phlebopus sp. FC_14]
MDYFSKFLRAGSRPPPKLTYDYAGEFNKSWNSIKATLEHPDERQLLKGIKSTDVPAHLQSMVDSLVWESSRTEEGGTGACLEYLLKNDVLGSLVSLSKHDRPSGIQAEVLRAAQNMVVLMDEQFLVHSAIHRAVLRLLRNCVGDDIQEQLDGRNKVMGAAKNAVRSQPSEYELDLVNLLCVLCSRIRSHRELLLIFFHDKHWYKSEPLFSIDEEDEEEQQEEEDEDDIDQGLKETSRRSTSPSQATIASIPTSSNTRNPEYEFLLFNYLLRFVHREGQIGDFARAGLLFLMDVAMSHNPVHRTGRGEDTFTASTYGETVGDPITDVALALAEYIVDGDFSDVLGAGLGAVYSLLPSKLSVRSPMTMDLNQASGMVLGITPENEEETAAERKTGFEDSNSPDFRARLDHFLRLLEFLQDIIRRNTDRDPAGSDFDASALVGTSIVQSILDAVRRIFLENVLYPSVLECSDLDGSAVAVMSYIDIMIRTLENEQLSDLLVSFLISEDNDDIKELHQQLHGTPRLSNEGPPRWQSSAFADKQVKFHQRKSSAMLLLEMETPGSRRQSEYFTSTGRFTLKDLLLSNLHSQNHPSVTAALQLLQTMLTRRCRVCTDGLVLVVPDTHATSFPEPTVIPTWLPDSSEEDSDDEHFIYPGAEDKPKSTVTAWTSLPTFVDPETTFSTHEREMGLYLTLVSRVDPSHNEEAFSTGYDHYLHDALAAIQSHSCFVHADEDMQSRLKHRHRLNVNDPLLSVILESLCKFFSNPPKMNISLTGVLSELALCPDRSIAGWLTCAVGGIRQKSTYSTPLHDIGDDQSIDFDIDQKLATETNILSAARLDENSRPVIYSIIQGLVVQLERYREVVDDFDKYLLQRRQGLLFSENLTDALTLALEPAIEPASMRASSPNSSLSITDIPPLRPRSKPKGSSLVSFLSPRKSNAAASQTQAIAEPQTPPLSAKKAVTSSPFASHYQQTRDIIVEPFVAPAPASGLWPTAKALEGSADEEDVFAAGAHWGGDSEKPKVAKDSAYPTEENGVAHITLSHLLDNVVILQECIKELAAIIQARRSLGIDAVRYV